MRVLIVTHYFPPETGAPQARLSALASTWAADGDKVAVLTGMPNHPTGVLAPAYRRAVFRRESVDGYRVIRTWLYATPNEGVARKTLGHLSFMASSVLLGWRAVGAADVVVVSSPTFFSILSGWLLARLKRARFVVEVRDLWPAIFVELGVLRNRRIIALLERLELAAYAAADQVVVVSEGFRADLIRRGVLPTKVHTIRNGVDLGRFVRATAADPGLRARLGAGPDDCLVLYAGTHGISQGLPAIADAAATLEAREANGTAAGGSVRFAFVGDGADKRRLERRVAELGLRTVTLLPGVPNAEMPALLAAADICLVPLRDVPLFATFIPSKMFEYLAAGKAIIGSVAGEAARILEEAGAAVVAPEDSGALAAVIADLATSAKRRAAMGLAGRAYAERSCDRAALAREYRKVLEYDGVAHRQQPRRGAMLSLAKSPIAPILGRRVPLRGPALLLNSSYARTRYTPGKSITRVTTAVGDTFESDLSSALDWQLWAFGGWERHLAELFRQLVRPGDRCVDVGANIGVHTVRLARLVGPDGEAIALEPDSGVLRRLQRNIELNGLPNVRVVNAAASDRGGEMQLYRPNAGDTNRGRASLLHHPYLTGTAATVPVVTLDDVCGGAPVALIKIDVEGHEAAVLRGAAGIVDACAPAVVFEYAPELFGGPANTPFDWLVERGFEIFSIQWARHPLTGRGRLAIDPLAGRPLLGGDLLAVAGDMIARVRAIMG
jgi:FkbM family methyltransferase